MEIDNYFSTEVQYRPDYLNELFYGILDPEELKQAAIRILDNPKSPKILRENALAFADAYKTYVNFEANTPSFSMERAICVDQNGRRTDLRAR